MRVAVAALNDKAFAKTLAAKLDRAKRVPLPAAPTPGSDTVYLTVVDRDRRAVSLINSLYSAFGTGDLHREDRRACSTTAARASCSIPAIRTRSARASGRCTPSSRRWRCATAAATRRFGVMGAHYQPMGHVQMVLNLFDYGMDMQSAIDAPRAFFEGEIHRGRARHAGRDRRGPARRAATTIVTAPSPWGGAQAIRIDWKRGVLIGGSEPRKDGCALGY